MILLLLILANVTEFFEQSGRSTHKIVFIIKNEITIIIIVKSYVIYTYIISTTIYVSN
jgi:hypothetical protein